MSGLDTRVAYDDRTGVTTLFLGWLTTTAAVASGLIAAKQEIDRHGGKNARAFFRDDQGQVVYSASLNAIK